MKALKLKIPPPIYLLAFLGLMWLLHVKLPVFQLVPPPWNKAGLLLVAFALLTDLLSLGLFFRAHTTFNPIHPERAKTLVTSGPYRYTRNPMYAGMLVILTGWGIFLGSFSPFLLLPLFVMLLTAQQIIPEEKILEEKFGGAYLAYKARVPRWFW